MPELCQTHPNGRLGLCMQPRDGLAINALLGSTTMTTQKDSTTRTKLADAINSVVTMSEAETEQMVDAGISAQPKQLL